MEKATGAALIVIGIVAVLAAIVASGVKVRDIEIGTVPSRMRQGLLGGFGVAVAIIGLMLIFDDDSGEQANNVEAAANLEQVNVPEGTDANTDLANTETVGPDANGTDTNVADENQPAENTGTEAQ